MCMSGKTQPLDNAPITNGLWTVKGDKVVYPLSDEHDNLHIEVLDAGERKINRLRVHVDRGNSNGRDDDPR